MVIWHLSWRVQYGFPSRVTRDQNVWKLKTTWNLCSTSLSNEHNISAICSPSYPERVYVQLKLNIGTHFLSDLTIALFWSKRSILLTRSDANFKKSILQNNLAQLDITFISFFDRSSILLERKIQTETSFWWRTMDCLHKVWHSPCLEYNIMYRMLVNFMGQ